MYTYQACIAGPINPIPRSSPQVGCLYSTVLYCTQVVCSTKSGMGIRNSVLSQTDMDPMHGNGRSPLLPTYLGTPSLPKYSSAVLDLQPH